MSIAILTQVYDETRRLAIAGSVVAPGDFRLKKLVDPLKKAGEKAPVFARVAQGVEAVIGSTEKTASTALLELSALVNSILYTQGETGLQGALQPIESVDLGQQQTQTSARMLKPLLEALTTTGSGRLEIIRDAQERGLFRDLRLVKPALAALDDVYGEIADLVAEKVLPIFGKAILPELRAQFEWKGKGGAARRLTLMHAIDPAGSRELVKQALDEGSKEVRVASIGCLGDAEEDRGYLLEQAQSKAQDVREAAYVSLAGINHPETIAALKKGLSAKDINLVSRAFHRKGTPHLASLLVEEIERQLGECKKGKDKKAIGAGCDRITTMLWCLEDRHDAGTEKLLLSLFAERDALLKLKGDGSSGSDVNEAVVRVMSSASPKCQMTLVEQRDSLPPERLDLVFPAARQHLTSAQLYDTFAPYLKVKLDEKKKPKDAAGARGYALCEALTDAADYAQYIYRVHRRIAEDGAYDDETDDGKLPPLDPRWLDDALRLENLSLIRALIRPGHKAVNAFLGQRFAEVLKKSKTLSDCHEVVSAMVAAQHPDATQAVIDCITKFVKKNDWYLYYFGQMIPELPLTAVPQLEALIPSLPDQVADRLLDYIQNLKETAKPK